LAGYRAIGQKGGAVTFAKYGADYYRRIGQLGGSKRRAKQRDPVTPAAEDQASAEAGGHDQKAEP
jgi:hypothetical protein